MRRGSLRPADAPDPQTLVWRSEMPLVTNPFVMIDAVKMFGGGALFPLVLLVVLAFWEGSYEGIAFAVRISVFLFVGLLLAAVLVMLLAFGNRMPYEYHVDRDGVWMASTSTRGAKLSRLAVVVGLLAGPRGLATAGAGILAQANAAAFLRWKDLGGLRLYPRSHRISLRNDWRRVILLEIPPELYPVVAARVSAEAERVQRHGAGAPRAASTAAVRGWLTLFVVVFTLALMGDAKPLDVSPGVALVAGVLAVAGLWARRRVSLVSAAGLMTLVIAFNAHAWFSGHFHHLGKPDWQLAVLAQMALTAFFIVLGLIILFGYVRSQRAS